MIKLVAAIVVMSMLGAAAWFIFEAGVGHERAKQAEIIADAGRKDDLAVKTVIEYKEKIRVIYRDKIKFIKSAKDSTGCADTKLIDMGFSLRQ